MENRSYIFILLAGICWGTIGYFAKILLSYNLTSLEVAFFRTFIGFFIIFICFLIVNRQVLKIDKRGMLYTLAIGILCQVVFNSLYFYAVKNVGVATSAVLLYTAPAFSLMASGMFLGENITKLKVISLLICLVGCFFTATGGDIHVLEANSFGLIAGLGAGFCYGMMPVLSKSIMGKYNNWTILLYVFGFASIVLFFMAGPSDLMNLGIGIKGWATIMLFGLIVSVVPFGLYYKGLSLGIEPSKASIIATTELVVAVIISLMAFNENFGPSKFLGVILVLISVILIQSADKKVKVVEA
ncbi:DMT family transporter [Anaeromicrobium sediminis]|uniref:EamA domain-containing protein n=1 Tax=Anaeromicrobium sediminis TaxID=1478221 RepID=A0A267MP39_9FIRM|nr:EamA family transporter [Anaeromicrobium sediminis]PAB60583.1 hypothetical protein CCE28_03300 [Anaeromicrobium sediminis]